MGINPFYSHLVPPEHPLFPGRACLKVPWLAHTNIDFATVKSVAVNKPYQLLHKSANSQQMYLNVLLKMPPPALYTLSGGLLMYRQDNNSR